MGASRAVHKSSSRGNIPVNPDLVKDERNIDVLRGRTRTGDDDVEYTVGARDVEELHRLQRSATTNIEDDLLHQQLASISDSLRHTQRKQGPKISKQVSIEKNAVGYHRLEPLEGDFMHQISDRGLKPTVVYHNLSPAELYEKALLYEPGTHIVANGALATLSGAKTGRTPRDKRLVMEEDCKDDIWWHTDTNGSPNYEMDEHTFLLNRERAIDYLNIQDRIYVFDGYAGWDPEYRLKVRVICTRPYHALFVHNLFIRPTEAELRDFGKPDFTIYNAGSFPANRYTSFMTSSTSVDLHLGRKEMVILGTQYAGEMKKGIFTVMNYLMPKRGVLSLHSGCNIGAAGDVTLFFGLSGTGKTTLSTDPHRPLIGDDEHCWGNSGIFNIEGGCYAKCIGLKKAQEPEIWEAIRFGAVVENVVFDEATRRVEFESGAITENTRAAYPIYFIPNARIPCVGGHAKNVILLCCDAFGVLPPVSKLTLEQAMYHFISGYTAKVAGTEEGVTEPQATFSACFGGAFLAWHPMKYASMLADKMREHGSHAWLINTGWTAGGYGVGYRMKLVHTRAILDSIHDGTLEKASFQETPVFGLQVPISVANVPENVLNPENAWADKAAYQATLKKLGRMYNANFDKYASGGGFVTKELASSIVAAGPQLQ